MKNIFKISLFASFLVFSLWSCKKEDNRITFKGGTAPVLTASDSGNIPLSINNKTAPALKFSWTNPDYQFSTGVSSLDVSYTLQIDSAGANFTSKELQEKSVAKDLSTTLTVGELNTFLGKLGLPVNVSHNFEVRVKASLTNEAAQLFSNVLKFTATNYLDVAVPLPASGELYITGDATPSDWTNSPPASQKFTRVSNTLFEITVPLKGGKSYTFLPVYGSWDSKYSIAKKNDPGLVNGGPFQVGGEDILAPAESGNYKISIDFVKGKFTVTKV
jgi:hypothetical protein